MLLGSRVCRRSVQCRVGTGYRTYRYICFFPGMKCAGGNLEGKEEAMVIDWNYPCSMQPPATFFISKKLTETARRLVGSENDLATCAKAPHFWAEGMMELQDDEQIAKSQTPQKYPSCFNIASGRLNPPILCR